MPYVRIAKCVYKKNKKNKPTKKKGCSNSEAQAKKYLKKLNMVDEALFDDIERYFYLKEAARDAKVLRNINIDYIKKETPKNADEDIRDYFARIQQMERDPEYLNPVFPKGLVDWIESLPDNHFPTNGRKRFAKWLGNKIYHQETEIQGRLNTVDNPEELAIYNNDVRYIADYLNGAEEFPKDLWERSLNGMFDLSTEWHDTLKYREDPTGDYENKEVVYDFGNGFTIVDIMTENDLEVEGNKMGHCVGGYCDAVAEGDVFIYSLRDKRNEPHATIEVRPAAYISRDQPPTKPSVDQIKGKGNDVPVEKYRPMIRQWLQSTDFSYEDNLDYLNMLPSEEIKEKLFSGNLKSSPELKLAQPAEDPEILSFFIEQLLATKKTIKSENYALTNSIVRNPMLDEDNRISLLKANLMLELPTLGERVQIILGITTAVGMAADIDVASLISRSWSELKEDLMSFGNLSPRITRNIMEEKMYYIKAYLEATQAEQSIKEELIEYITGEQFLNEVSSRVSPLAISMAYGGSIQGYLHSLSPSPGQIHRIYLLLQDERFQSLLGGIGRLHGYISGSRAMSNKLARNIIKDVKNKKHWQMPQRHLMDIIMNPRVNDSVRIQLLNVGEQSIVDLTRLGTVKGPYGDDAGSGLYWSVSGRSHSRNLVNAATNGEFSDKFVKYMIDAGIFDVQYVMDLVGEKTKLTGQRPRIEKYDNEESQKMLSVARNRIMAEYSAGRFSESDAGADFAQAPWVNESNVALDSEIIKYFNNLFVK